MLAGIWIHTLVVGVIQRPCPSTNNQILSAGLRRNNPIQRQCPSSNTLSPAIRRNNPIHRHCPSSNTLIKTPSNMDDEIIILSSTANETAEKTDVNDPANEYDEKDCKDDTNMCEVNSQCLVISQEQCNSNIESHTTCQSERSRETSYLNLLSKPRVLHAYVILFLGVFGAFGKDLFYTFSYIVSLFSNHILFFEQIPPY